ncbi:MAG: Clp protease N-terminal domain-containing protein [Candidatus Obscuribacterales bacterium]|nr:Clp protease N-terminal domain-containing protein [Candidatus Obscuribacterales bacterium]
MKTTAIGAGADDDSDLFKLMQDEARRLGQNFVGTEQILIALVSCHSGIAHGVLADLGFTLEVARAEVESIIGRGSGFVAVEIPFTPRAKRVLELAWDEARQLGHNYIGSEHILLGLVREGEGVGARVLKKLNIDRTLVRDCVKKRLKSKGEE